VKQALLRALQTLLPLALRCRLAVWLDRQSIFSSGKWWAVRLLSDFAAADVDGYHRFLWKHHLGYAESYEIEQRFGTQQIHATRHILFNELERWFEGREIALRDDIHSVFEVGCSLGYLLRYLETDLLRAPQRLAGVDIDETAIRQGASYLRSLESIVELHAADMDRLPELLAATRYDLFLCCGVLMYTRSDQAQRIVETMLEHGRYVAISGLAHPERDNRELTESTVRERDGTFIHNVDELVERAGGRVLYRRWDGAEMIDGNTIYFVLAERAEGGSK